MPPDSIISDLKKFVSPECIEALEKTVEDAKSQMMSDREKKNNDDTDDAKSKSKGGDKDQKKKEKQKKPSLSDLKKVAANLVKSLLSVIEKNGGVKDVIYDSENRRVAWSYLQVMYQKYIHYVVLICLWTYYIHIYQ